MSSGCDDANEEAIELEHGNLGTRSNNVSPQADTSALSCPHAFVISDGPEKGTASWWAVRTLTPTGRRRGATNPRSKVIAVAVRKSESAKFSKILRFMCCDLSTLSKISEA